MADSSGLNRGYEAPASQRKQERKGDGFENSEKLDSLKTAGREAAFNGIGVEGSENVEGVEVSGEVSEVMSEAREQKGDSVAQAHHSTDPSEIKENLLKNLPSEHKMRAEVQKEVQKEIRYLRNKAMKMIYSPGDISYFEMTNILKKIRELRGILSILGKAAAEKLKTLWLRFVHGVI